MPLSDRPAGHEGEGTFAPDGVSYLVDQLLLYAAIIPRTLVRRHLVHL